jgi:hypothetical protein
MSYFLMGGGGGGVVQISYPKKVAAFSDLVTLNILMLVSFPPHKFSRSPH